MKKFNINNYVYFKPTKLAHELYEKYWSSYGGQKLKVNEDGFAEMQMHSFMHIFGEVSYVGMGNNISENCEIYFNEGDLE